MEHNTYVVLCVGFITFLAYLYVRSVVIWRARTRGRPFPPGPTPLPIIGNLLSLPRYLPWTAYRDFSAQYGDIIHFRALGQSVVVLGSTSVIYEYLDKRSANTSDRTQTPMIELSGSALNLGFMPYGQWWRRHRRAFWQYFHQEAALKYRPTQRAFAHRFLGKLLSDPAGLKEHIRYSFAGAVLKVAYNIDIDKWSVDYLSIVNEALMGPAEGLVPGLFLVEYLPFLRYIPPWFPGASSQRLFARWQAAGNRLKNTPFNEVKAMIGGLASEEPWFDSVVGKLLLKLAGREDDSYLLEEEEEIIKNVGAVALEAGADTTFSTAQGMFLAMSLYPDVLKKAHAELDTVVGPYRLPDFDDKDSLFYVQAIIRESFRWHNVLPLGASHCTLVDDELHGYFIPAGTTLIPNIWACMHDPDSFEEPEQFRPERFIKDGKFDATPCDPMTFAFGFGRRTCPGRYFAEAAFFINVASVLHVFDISPPIGNDGTPIKIEPRMTNGMLSYPEDCRCTIKPRSAAAEALIRQHAAEAV